MSFRARSAALLYANTKRFFLVVLDDDFAFRLRLKVVLFSLLVRAKEDDEGASLLDDFDEEEDIGSLFFFSQQSARKAVLKSFYETKWTLELFRVLKSLVFSTKRPLR